MRTDEMLAVEELNDERLRLRAENAKLKVRMHNAREAIQHGWSPVGDGVERTFYDDAIAALGEQGKKCKHGLGDGHNPCLYCEHEAGRGPLR